MSAKDDLIAEAKAKGLVVPEGATKAEVTEILNDHAKSVADEGKTPSETAAEDVDKSGVQGVSEGSTVNEGAGEGDPEAKSEGANDEDQTVAAQADGIDGVDRDHTPAGTTEEANSETEAGDRITPPVAANPLSADATDEAYNANNQVAPGTTPAEVRDAELQDNADKVETHKAEAKAVETELGTSTEEAAAARAGVDEARLNDPKQNREPKNEFEASNQKVTEEERQAAQEVSDMTTADRESEAPTPNEAAHTDAERTAGTNQGSDIAAAIVAGLKESKADNFKLQAEPDVEPRFTLVKNKQTGEVMIRENETGTLSKIQLLSLEEKEADVQSTEVEEL